jgi:hypothetical protein
VRVRCRGRGKRVHDARTDASVTARDDDHLVRAVERKRGRRRRHLLRRVCARVSSERAYFRGVVVRRTLSPECPSIETSFGEVMKTRDFV